MIAQNNKTTVLKTAVLTLTMLAFVGCQSKQDKAIEQAKKQAAATGQAQQVISVDKSGNTTTTTVQPPVPGQTGQQVTTTVSTYVGTRETVTGVSGRRRCRAQRLRRTRHG